jgi:4-aminobutyrate aminotransferase-like enzyme
VRDTCFKAGVLIGVGGTNANVLRLQPPLVITQEQLDTALEVLEGAITEVANRVAAVAGKA